MKDQEEWRGAIEVSGKKARREKRGGGGGRM